MPILENNSRRQWFDLTCHDNGNFTVKKGEPPTTSASKQPQSKPVFKKQDLLKFFTPLFALFNAEIKKAEVDIENVEYEINKTNYRGFKNGISCCYVMLQEYIKQNGSE